ncbi:MAG: tRNA dihydrouridine synthase DusB [Acholeplasmatales bacterium]|nr:tRNA dihydrouridine synthase DusB [Acholeplasmatales bacterium]
MEWKIRDVIIPNKLVLAPMAGVTNEAFRIICKEYNAGLVMAEMVSDKAIGFQNKKTLGMTKVNKIEHPISMQIFGSDVESMVNAAKYIDEYSDADIIDINMGCPVNKVAKKALAGASLLQYPDKVYEIVKNVVEAVKKPVTVKIRAGWDSEHINCVEIAKLCEKAGASAITVHGRTRAQMYQGKANLDYIKAVKEAVSIPVIGNGDIVDIESAKHMFEYTGCDAIAIARGALGNPFLFRELDSYFNNGKILPKATNVEIYETIVKHYNYLLELKGAHLAMLEMRSHISWYIKGMPGSAKIKDFCNKQTDFNIVLNTIKEYLNV